MTFDPSHSEVERNPELAKKYASMIEEAVGHDARVVGMLEIGSFAKGEAVPTSDTDTRIYIELPNHILRQTSGSRFATLKSSQGIDDFDEFTASQSLETISFDWFEFNNPLTEKISQELGVNVEFGFVDRRFADWALSRLPSHACEEYALLFQSHIFYDPDGYLSQSREALAGCVYPSLVTFYHERYLDALPFEIYTHLESNEMDAHKIQKSGQIQWVKWAVRCIRDAVASKTYIDTGTFIFKKTDVLAYIAEHLPNDLAFVGELYSWKTDADIRAKMVSDFIENPNAFFPIFREKTSQIEKIVARIKSLSNVFVSPSG